MTEKLLKMNSMNFMNFDWAPAGRYLIFCERKNNEKN
jgi:hypothetical protein